MKTHLAGRAQIVLLRPALVNVLMDTLEWAPLRIGWQNGSALLTRNTAEDWTGRK
jgi:hypothetical protein